MGAETWETAQEALEAATLALEAARLVQIDPETLLSEWQALQLAWSAMT